MTRFLLDTNCFIQVVRQRPDAPQVLALLTGVPRDRLFITDYAVHSIGVIMRRFGQLAAYTAFLAQIGIDQGIGTIVIPTADLGRLVAASASYNLDYDDAYQYAAAELHRLALVSLDADFDRTPRGRLTPAAALNQFTAGQQSPP